MSDESDPIKHEASAAPRRTWRMIQPAKDVLRQTIREREAEIADLRAEIERLNTLLSCAPWWRRVLNWRIFRARVAGPRA